MPEPVVTVAIPTRDGGPLFERVLTALAEQTVAHELLVCDSGSADGSPAAARAHGARVIEIAPTEFGHGRTRNLLMREARGTHVALLTQDAEPASPRWLESLLAGFALADDVAVAFGPYLPRPDAPVPVRIELERWFASLPAGVERLSADERRELPAPAFVGRRGFLSDANACIRRDAWRQVPFRDVSYAEDRALALELLRAGYAKAYVRDAAVLHSHRYGTLAQLRRSFDESRGLLEVCGWREPAAPVRFVSQLRGEVGAASRDPHVRAAGVPTRVAVLAGVARHHAARQTGAILGSRADRLPPVARRLLSLERRATFAPLQLDAPGGAEPPDPTRQL
ncbi:MAG TPA: glycosyltransferase family 2 protein [Solirubrobacteraceae bacterium]|nr:glycosyltransferase family 2 protein [Solirubrobacteraceae bacterium]